MAVCKYYWQGLSSEPYETHGSCQRYRHIYLQTLPILLLFNSCARKPPGVALCQNQKFLAHTAAVPAGSHGNCGILASKQQFRPSSSNLAPQPFAGHQTHPSYRGSCLHFSLVIPQNDYWPPQIQRLILRNLGLQPLPGVIGGLPMPSIESCPLLGEQALRKAEIGRWGFAGRPCKLLRCTSSKGWGTGCRLSRAKVQRPPPKWNPPAAGHFAGRSL